MAKPPLSTLQHRQAGLLLNQIFDALDQLRNIMPNRNLKDRCSKAHRYVKTHLRDHLRFTILEAERRPDGTHAYSLDDSHKIYGIKSIE